MIAFLLIVTGSILIFINVKAIKKEKGSFGETLKVSMENIDEYKEEMGLIRKEFAETLIDIQKEMEYLKKELNILKHTYENNIRVENLYKKNYNANYPRESYDNSVQSKHIENKNMENISPEINVEEDILENNNYKNSLQDENNIKVNEVNKLFEEGYTTEEISEILNIGKGEVILIKELYSK